MPNLIVFCNCRGELGAKEDGSSMSTSSGDTSTDDDVLKSSALPNSASNPCSYSCLHSNIQEVHCWHYEEDKGLSLQNVLLQNVIIICHCVSLFLSLLFAKTYVRVLSFPFGGALQKNMLEFCHFPLGGHYIITSHREWPSLTHPPC